MALWNNTREWPLTSHMNPEPLPTIMNIPKAFSVGSIPALSRLFLVCASASTTTVTIWALPHSLHWKWKPLYFLVKSNRKSPSFWELESWLSWSTIALQAISENDNFLNPGTQAHKNKTSTSTCLIRLLSVQKNCRHWFQLNNYLSTLELSSNNETNSSPEASIKEYTEKPACRKVQSLWFQNPHSSLL